MSLRPTKIPKTTQDLLDAAYETELKKEIKPLAYEINERINRLDSQDREGEPPLRDEFGKSAWDYSMIKYKITLGELKDDLEGQLVLLRTLFYGLGPSVMDEKKEAERLKAKIEASAIQTSGTKNQSQIEAKEDSNKTK